MSITILRGNALALPLADASVDLVVTSPPYFGLRSYQDGGEHYEGQIGSEATPAEFLDALIAATREIVRVLKPSGSIFVNLGDKMADKSLMLLPERYRIRAVDELGLIARAVIVWSKCLSGGTTVYARTKGREQAIRLHDLCRHYSPEDVELWTGEKWSRVRAWEPTVRGETQYEITLRSGERIGCTPEHRWPTNRGLLRSDELRVGDVLNTAPLPDGTTLPAGLDDEMVGWFVGLYIAEGSRSGQTIQFAGHVKEVDRFRRLSEVAAAYHGTARLHHTGGNAPSINMTGPALRAILDLYVGGRTAKDKHLAPKCWQRSNRFLRSLLDGYLAGDGHWREDANRWVLSFTNNDALASDLRTLGARLGLSVRLSRCTHTGYGRNWPGWRGNITSPHRRRRPDSEVVAVGPSRARQFWDVAIEDEPHLFALASGVLTHNSNGLPESVADRVRRSHEDWVHLTKRPRYYSAVDEIREPHKSEPGREGAGALGGQKTLRPVGPNSGSYNALGALPGSVWTVATEPLRVPESLGVNHFAAFPSELPRRIITGWSPREVCTACGEGRRPAAQKATSGRARSDAGDGGRGNRLPDYADVNRADWQERVTRRVTGYACACPDTSAPATPGVVLDVFGGTGTTALVADVLGRDGITVDLSADYCRLAQWRTTDPKQRAKAARVEAVEPVSDDQPDLFEEPA